MKKTLPGIAVLIAAGLAGNILGYPIFFSTNFLFGSIFSMLALQIFGLVPGIIAAIAVSAGTYFSSDFLQNFPVLIGEVIAVGWFSYRKGKSFVVTDTLYWLFVGMPFSYLCASFVIDLHPSLTFVVIFKQAINGICNALVARMLFMLVQVKERNHLFPLREVVFNLLALFMLIPSLAILTYESLHDFHQFDLKIRQKLHGESRYTANSLNLWLHEKIIRLSNLAWRKKNYHEVTSAHLDAMRELDSDLAKVGIIDKNAISTMFSPAVDELGDSTIGIDFSDRPYLAELKKTLRPQLSEVILSKFGKADPIVVIAAPIVAGGGAYDGYAAGIFQIQKIKQILSLAGREDGLGFILIDKNNLVIASTQRGLPTMVPFVREGGEEKRLAGGIVQWVPDHPGRASSYDRWLKSVYFIESEVGDQGEWTLIVEQSVAPHRMELSAIYSNQLKIVFGILLLTIFFAEVVSRTFLSAFNRLHDISRQLQDDITMVDHAIWPTSMVHEVNFLITAVKEMAGLLIEKICEIRNINEGLEERIEERTRQYEELNASLETQVVAEVERRHKQEHLLVQQAKLASMGEMLGAIAHQWRQPLNTLGLCVQNINDSYRFGELDQGYLDTTVGECMVQISQMSKTIDDFRDFFKPDKEPTMFDAMAAVGEVLVLFSAQLRVHGIRFVLSCLTHQRSFGRVEEVVPCGAKKIVGHKNEFKHVILNLVNNAKDSICERRAKGLMGVEEHGCMYFDFLNADEKLIISVRDNGIGIPAYLRDRVFEPYFTTKDPGYGTGIGLYLSKIIIEDHMHGQLTVEESTHGANFVMTIPAANTEVS